MVTRYILAGGNDRATNTYWEKLAKVIPHDKPLYVLSCLFARNEDWQTFYKGYIPYFEIAFGDDVSVEVADPERFEEQAKRADVIYLHGGNTLQLKKYLEPFNVQELFTDKVVIGSSAGSQFLSTKYWSPTSRKVHDGLQLTPINTLVHYGSDYGSDDPRGPIDWEKAKQELQAAVGNQEVTPIPEGNFVEFTA